MSSEKLSDSSVILQDISKEEKPKKKSKIFKIFLIFFICLLIVFGGISSFFFYKIFSLQKQIFQTKETNFFQMVKDLTLTKDSEKNPLNSRINILLLGIPGEKEKGSYLTDSIIIASFEKKQGRIAFFSIPRDLYAPFPYQEKISSELRTWGKINGIYPFYQFQKKKDGIEALRETIKETLGISLDYYFLMDFSGFRKIIDTLGGIDIYLEKGFVDQSFPGPNDSYQVVSFEKGWQHLDGQRALQFVRSRHGTNGEGSDFARAERQQKVLKAISDKVFSFRILSNPFKINELFSILEDHLKTDLSSQEAVEMASLFKKEKSEIINFVPRTGEDQLLYSEHSPTAGYILRPEGKNFFELKFILENIFSLKEIEEEKGKIKIFYSDSKNLGLAKELSQGLRRTGFLTDESVSFCKDCDSSLEKTVYSLNKDKKDTLEGLKKYLFSFEKEYLEEKSVFGTKTNLFLFKESLSPFSLSEKEETDKEKADFVVVF